MESSAQPQPDKNASNANGNKSEDEKSQEAESKSPSLAQTLMQALKNMMSNSQASNRIAVEIRKRRSLRKPERRREILISPAQTKPTRAAIRKAAPTRNRKHLRVPAMALETRPGLKEMRANLESHQ